MDMLRGPSTSVHTGDSPINGCTDLASDRSARMLHWQWRMQDFLKGGSVTQSRAKILEATPIFDRF